MKGLDDGLLEVKIHPNKSMSAKPCDRRGVIVLGDAFNMRHPIIASGMMVALSDVLIIRNLLRSLPNIGNTKKVSELIKSFYIIRKVGCFYKCIKVKWILYFKKGKKWQYI